MPGAVRRLAGLLATLLVVSLVIFVILDILPGDPAAIMLGTSATPETLATLRHDMGLDLPAPVRYLRWLGGLLTGHLGTSTTYGVPVAGLIGERLAVTLPLAFLAILIAVALALPLGAVAGARPKSIAGHAETLISEIGIAVPNFWIGLLLILFVSLHLGWLPAGGFPGWSAGPGPAFGALLLPAIALGVPQAAVLMRVTRAAVADVGHQDFVRTAAAKGLGPETILWRHVLPNALIPVVTIIGLQVSFLIAGAILVENVFTLPGLGRLAWQALAQRDLAVIQVVVLFFAAMVLVVNWAVDELYAVIDPRLRDRW